MITSEQVSLNVQLRVREGRIEEFLRAFQPVIDGARDEEPGCLRYELSQNIENPQDFHVYEVYRDEAALLAHREAPHFLEWQDLAPGILEENGRTVWINRVINVDFGDQKSSFERAPGGEIWLDNEAQWLDRGKGVHSRPLAGADVGATSVLTGMTEIPVGGEIPLHHHNTDEFILILKGSAVVTLGDREEPVSAGDSTLAHPGIKHRYINVGDEPLRILWVYGDINTTRTIAETGITLGHLDRYDG